ncbi:hypothetical protein EUZ85_11535 [Hahella sp. KA22]|uniref:hypothetical protein n=1 Tax=Hahella sp. KA22 TaxID=1628392 RepID=UPI000FDE3EBD|nr:hypothetical protein [Hahella sp. KA22]AZZ91328.1 hypothetical protein ENC22_08975 [Hahella sp. KA22]QAY54697.1 hypothetical protein EUZ85_11535 [Hahella sp. KA22]
MKIERWRRVAFEEKSLWPEKIALGFVWLLIFTSGHNLWNSYPLLCLFVLLLGAGALWRIVRGIKYRWVLDALLSYDGDRAVFNLCPERKGAHPIEVLISKVELIRYSSTFVYFEGAYPYAKEACFAKKFLPHIKTLISNIQASYPNIKVEEV